MLQHLSATFNALVVAVAVAAGGTLLWRLYHPAPDTRLVEAASGMSIPPEAVTHVRGNGRLALIEFSDFECAFGRCTTVSSRSPRRWNRRPSRARRSSRRRSGTVHGVPDKRRDGSRSASRGEARAAPGRHVDADVLRRRRRAEWHHRVREKDQRRGDVRSVQGGPAANYWGGDRLGRAHTNGQNLPASVHADHR